MRSLHASSTLAALLILAATVSAAPRTGGTDNFFSAYYDAGNNLRLQLRLDDTRLAGQDAPLQVRVYLDRSSRNGGDDYTAFPAPPFQAGPRHEIVVRSRALAQVGADVLYVELWRQARRGHWVRETRVEVLDIPGIVAFRPETLTISPQSNRRTSNTDPASIFPNDLNDVETGARPGIGGPTRDRTADEPSRTEFPRGIDDTELAPPAPCPVCGPGSGRDWSGPIGRTPSRMNSLPAGNVESSLDPAPADGDHADGSSGASDLMPNDGADGGATMGPDDAGNGPRHDGPDGDFLDPTDCNRNGVPDVVEIAQDTTLDSDADGLLDSCKDEGDIDGSGTTDAADLAALILAWGPCTERNCRADLNQDYQIDSTDLVLLLSHLDP